jgi:hypothetical protein
LLHSAPLRQGLGLPRFPSGSGVELLQIIPEL